VLSRISAPASANRQNSVKIPVASLRIHEFSTDSRVGRVLREFIADAEERLELLEKEKRRVQQHGKGRPE
jgi:hypothetical protein